MRTDRLRELADVIEQAPHFRHEWPLNSIGATELIISVVHGLPDSFNLGAWCYTSDSDCGTTACIAGYAVGLFAPDDTVGEAGISAQAAELLDLTDEQSMELFTPSNFATRMPQGEVTPQQVADALRLLANEPDMEIREVWRTSCES